MGQNIKTITKTYNLEERVSIFSEKLILFCKSLTISTISRPLIDQLLRSGTSIGANYMEANACDSKKDFINKVSISRKESKETLYWIRLLAVEFPDRKESLRTLWKETHELSLILGGILKSSKASNPKIFKI